MKITKIAPAQWAVVDAAGFELFTGSLVDCERFLETESSFDWQAIGDVVGRIVDDVRRKRGE